MLVRHEIDNNLVMCSVCSGQLISDPDTGEEICSSCGIVARDNLELAAERRLHALRHEGVWLTVNTPKDLRVASEYLAEHPGWPG